MRHSTTSEMREGIEIFRLQDGEYAYAEIAPSLGNNCFAYRTTVDVLESIPFEEFSKRAKSYEIPVLFPYPNRIRDGKFSFQGEVYEVNPTQHGYVRDRVWKVVDSGASDEEGAWLTSRFDAIEYAEEILTQFPSAFTLDMTYRLKNGKLTLTATAENTGKRDMPAGFGIHPYFRLPEQCKIQVPANRRWELENNLPTGKLLDVEGQYDIRQLRDTAGLSFDDIYTDLNPDADGLVRCRLSDEENNTQTVVEFDAKEFPHVVVYTPPRKAICIEPNTCPTDAFNLAERGMKSDVIVLKPGDSTSVSITIYTVPAS